MVQKRPKMVSWEDLEAILAVSRAGSVRLAAASLGVAHTTLSRRVSNAEQALGVVAYIRGTKGYALTTAGQTIVDHAQRMALEAQHLQREIHGRDHTAAGHVRISLPLPVLTHLLSAHLVAFKEMYPRITLEFQTGQGFSDLDQYESDVAIRFQNFPNNNLVGTKVGTSFEAAYAVKEMLASLQADNLKPVPIIAWRMSWVKSN
jgi:DNA-binding transcriptional LysR family regulator